MTRLQARAPRLSPRLGAWLLALLSLVSGYLISRAQQVVSRPPLVLGQDAAYGDPAAAPRVRLEQVGGPVINIEPAGTADTLLVLYPGGLVRPQAYEWLGHALSAAGVQTVIPAFPADLAVLQSGRAAGLIERYGQGKRVFLAGHSLGGAMAAQFAASNAPKLAGLILMAAYPAGNVNLAGQSLPALSLLAERDTVAKDADVRGGLARLPQGARLAVIRGAVHSFFGRYGPQAGDGQPTVTRAQAEADIVREIRAFLDATPR